MYFILAYFYPQSSAISDIIVEPSSEISPETTFDPTTPSSAYKRNMFILIVVVLAIFVVTSIVNELVDVQGNDN